MDCHLVPRFYLAGFADPDSALGNKGRVWKYRFDLGKWHPASPRSVASEIDYYVTADTDGNRDERIERQILGPIEDKMAKLMRSRLKPGTLLCNEDRVTMAQFVALISLRTRYSHQMIGEAVADVSETALLMACAMTEHDPTSASVRELLRTHRVQVSPKMPMLVSLSLLNDTADDLMRMGWSLVVARPSEYFVSSDDPYRQVDPDANPPSAHGGLGRGNVEVSLPLSRNLAFFAGWHSTGCRWREAPHGFVQEINRRTCMSASIIAAPKPALAGFDQVLRDWEARTSHLGSGGLA